MGAETTEITKKLQSADHVVAPLREMRREVEGLMRQELDDAVNRHVQNLDDRFQNVSAKIGTVGVNVLVDVNKRSDIFEEKMREYVKALVK